MPEPDDVEWGLCDHYLLPADYRDDEEDDYDDECEVFRDLYGEVEAEDEDEPILDLMTRVAIEIKAGREMVPPGWKLGWPSPEVLIWTAPSGRHHASILNGSHSRHK